MKPGEILFGDGPIVLNRDRRTAEIEVRNASDHAIFVSSHYPFFEVNRRLVFDRARAWGMHLDIPAGDSERWRPDEVRRVRLVAFGGRGVVLGFNRLTEGAASPERLAGGLSACASPDTVTVRRLAVAREIDRPQYAARYGPTTGDRIRLGDTNLLALVERDESSYGDELVRGWGKTMRTGIMMSDRVPPASELDLIIASVVVIDPVLGVFKANIGVKDGRIVGVGRAGNPDVVDNPDLLVGSTTAPVYGLGYIATPGGIDTHVHLVQPRLIPVALAAGMTTLITGGLNDNPAYNLRECSMRSSTTRSNLGILGRAASTVPDPLLRQIESGVCGLKVHEDYAGYPSVIDKR